MAAVQRRSFPAAASTLTVHAVSLNAPGNTAAAKDVTSASNGG
jgi:hypothetical protein